MTTTEPFCSTVLPGLESLNLDRVPDEGVDIDSVCGAMAKALRVAKNLRRFSFKKVMSSFEQASQLLLAMAETGESGRWQALAVVSFERNTSCEQPKEGVDALIKIVSTSAELQECLLDFAVFSSDDQARLSDALEGKSGLQNVGNLYRDVWAEEHRAKIEKQIESQ